MSSDYLQTIDELREHLNDQLGFLEASTDAYDNGFTGEAKRLALSLRVLLHDTSGSKSLLGQLGLMGVAFHDSLQPMDPETLLPFSGLTALSVSQEGATYIPILDDAPPEFVRRVDFGIWWQETVFVDRDHRKFTRRDLVLALANKDGGGHVDPKLNESYAALSRHNSLGWVQVKDSVATPLDAPERAAVRQMAHEVPKTLKPGYEKRSVVKTGETHYLNVTIRPKQPKSLTRKVGRNEPRPCGSGKKYKYCCMRSANLSS